ncbi:maltotransferase domain-containing protein, partial [Actinokineospora sp.]|uniref:maltotransferase domain-containing protein n=1 Tax=Actinokineospora sp. TaxID=1872133 RepID=UPI003D6A2E09
MSGRLAIDDVSPIVSCGRYPSKAVVGEHIPVRATVWREGHDAVAATVTWRGPGDGRARRTAMKPFSEDRFTADIVPDHTGLWTVRVDAWSDPWVTWRHTVEVKVAAAQGPEELANDLESGARLLDRVSRRPDRSTDRKLLASAARALRDVSLPLPARIAEAVSEAVHRVMTEHPVRELLTKGKPLQIWVDRKPALYGSWYEFFPRSTGGVDANGRAVHGTFKTATKELDRVADMGFDVVYLPPIHPIGAVNRKGPNN